MIKLNNQYYISCDEAERLTISSNLSITETLDQIYGGISFFENHLDEEKFLDDLCKDGNFLVFNTEDNRWLHSPLWIEEILEQYKLFENKYYTVYGLNNLKIYVLDVDGIGFDKYDSWRDFRNYLLGGLP